MTPKYPDAVSRRFRRRPRRRPRHRLRRRPRHRLHRRPRHQPGLMMRRARCCITTAHRTVALSCNVELLRVAFAHGCGEPTAGQCRRRV